MALPVLTGTKDFLTDDYDNGSLGRMGYQAQEFDDESGELISSDDDSFDDEEFDAEVEDSAQTSISPKRCPPNCAFPPSGCWVTSE